MKMDEAEKMERAVDGLREAHLNLDSVIQEAMAAQRRINEHLAVLLDEESGAEWTLSNGVTGYWEQRFPANGGK